jgi:hypothetical protein
MITAKKREVLEKKEINHIAKKFEYYSPKKDEPMPYEELD